MELERSVVGRLALLLPNAGILAWLAACCSLDPDDAGYWF